jgi:outer membrane protein
LPYNIAKPTFVVILPVVNDLIMNKLSAALNVILLAAVGYLYYYNFLGKKTGAIPPNTAVAAKATDSNLNQLRIAFVELDSLNENLVYFKQRRKELELQQKQIETEYTNGYKQLEAKQNNFRQKNPNASPEEVQNITAVLTKDQQEIETKKQSQTQGLNQKSFDLMENIQKKLKQFLADYNKQKKYQYILTTGSGLDYLIYKDSSLNITNDVIKGMNQIMKPGANK